MAKSNFVKSARTDIYRYGTRTKADNKQGFKLDRSIPENKDDELLVKKGESYYWWQFNFNPHKYISKTPPKQSQLTQSEFLSTYYGIQESISEKEFGWENFEDDIQEIVSEIQELLDGTQEKLDNMPEQLQDSDSGQILQERIEALESWISDLESIDTTVEHDDETEVCEYETEAQLLEYIESHHEIESSLDELKTKSKEYFERMKGDFNASIEKCDIPKGETIQSFFITDNYSVNLSDGDDKFILGIMKHFVIAELRKSIIEDKAEEVRNCECSL